MEILKGNASQRVALPPSSVPKVKRQVLAASGGRVTGPGSASGPSWLSCSVYEQVDTVRMKMETVAPN